MDLTNFKFTETLTAFNIKRNLTIGMRFNTGWCEDLVWYVDLLEQGYKLNLAIINGFQIQVKLLHKNLKQLIEDAKNTDDLEIKNIKLNNILDLEQDLERLLNKYG